MIRAFLVTCLLMVAFESLRADYMSVVLKDEPSGYWRLGEEEVDDGLVDSSGNDLDGEYFPNGNLGLELGFPGALEEDDDTAVRFQTTLDSAAVIAAWGRYLSRRSSISAPSLTDPR